MKTIAEICCGSVEDVLYAQKAGADRIELNNAMSLTGLTPSIGTLKLAVANCNVPIVAMARPRPGGFNYNKYEFETMLADIEAMITYDIEGVAFGCLDKNGDIDKEKNEIIINLLHEYGKDAVFHRAFDCVLDPFKAIETLIDLGVKRVLTSGLQARAIEGVDLLGQLHQEYGDKIEILVGGGVNASNVSDIIHQTNINQFHSSCTGWRKDPTTITENVSFAFAEPPHEQDYNIVDYATAVEFVQGVNAAAE
ncbi:copper homeostasis protein CutC [Oceanobacillus sp. HCA-5259]|uniref:copper homeostasis protein CutC n=1 Tax=Oceanobacillus sp. HCA-5259 TaxID=3134661 RepID=UPI0030BCDA64